MQKLLTLLMAVLVPALAHSQTVTIASDTPYYDDKIIQANIVNECEALGTKLSNFTKEYGSKQKFNIVQTSEFDANAPGFQLKMEINNAVSTGNAWMGHKKMVTIGIALYKDGKMLAEHSLSRNSGGGIGAGFKGSCDVLGRCVKALGKDTSKWLARWRKEGKFK